jgi:hypothetical protein
MQRHRQTTAMVVAAAAIGLSVFVAAQARDAKAVLPPGSTVSQWDKIAEDTVVGSGAFQNESFIYMAYATQAMYEAISPGERKGQSADAAVIGAASTVLTHYFPAQASAIGALRQEALAALPDNQATEVGLRYGDRTANKLIAAREGDGLQTPIASTSTFPKLTPGPGVWRLTPTAFAAPQTPWVGDVRPFILESAGQFLPPPPPSLQSSTWVTDFNEVKTHGSSTNPDATERSTAMFWTANVVRQYNRLVREVAAAQGSSLVDTARLMAMVNVVAADAGISVMHAKYHYLFWRPVTAINGSLDLTAVTNDGFGPVPGYEDGNSATVEQASWRPLLTTPNHPEYPAAHGAITSAMAEVFSTFLGTKKIDLDVHGFDAAGAVGNLDAVRHFDRANDLRHEIIDARLWAGLHYRFSSVAGVVLGRKVAKYDLRHAFKK